MKTNTVFYRGIVNSSISRYGLYLFQFISMVLLARIFSPEIYGIITAATVFFIFFQMMTETGLGPAIINLKVFKIDDRNGLFGLLIFCGLITSITLFFLNEFLGNLYGSEKLSDVIPHVSLAIFFVFCSAVPNAFLLREKSFYKIATAGILAECIGTSFAVFLAYAIPPHEALAFRMPILSMVNFFIIYMFSSYTEFGRPKPTLNFKAIKPLLEFVKYQFGFNLVNFFSRNIDSILIGKYLGFNILGAYDRAYQLMKYPLMALTFAMTPAIQPEIRKNNKNKKVIYALHKEFTLRLSFIAIIPGFLMWYLSDWIINILFGSNWSEAIPILKILSISVPIQIILSTSGSFFQGMNQPKILFYVGLVNSFLTISGIIFGIYLNNLQMLCWLIVITTHINFVICYIVMHERCYQESSIKFFLGVSHLFFATALMSFFTI